METGAGEEKAESAPSGNIKTGEQKKMELKIEEYRIPERIDFNYEELKAALIEEVSPYETLFYTNDQMQDAKKDRAKLNRFKKAVYDERKRREQEYMRPFIEFKDKLNDCIGIVDRGISSIDKQIKEYETEKKNKKMEEIKEAWSAMDVPEGLTLEKVFDERMLNVSFNMRHARTCFEDAIKRFKANMETLSKLPEYAFEARQEYISSLDMRAALNEANRLSQMAKEKAEYEAAQEKRELDKTADVITKEELEESKKEYKDAASVDDIRPKAEPARQWVAFQALLSTDEALALRDFFIQNHIEFKAV